MRTYSFLRTIRSSARVVTRSAARALRRVGELFGLSLARTKDYYSPLPVESRIRKTLGRWNRPGDLPGVRYDLEQMKRFLDGLVGESLAEFQALPDYTTCQSFGFGPGYTHLDAAVLYMMFRHLRPRRYLEVGSGLSTYYAGRAAEKNAGTGPAARMVCIEPNPYDRLLSLPGIEVVAHEVQATGVSRFLELQRDDILFIDSSHVVRLDGDVPFLYLEVLPRLNPGVVIHIHDIPFPYNIPYPPQLWVLGQMAASPKWPRYWTEAMLVQAFLAFNDAFEILLSTPMIRFHDEDFLRSRFSFYRSIDEEPNTFSSLWLRKTR